MNDGPPSDLDARDRLSRALPVTCLVAVALVQIALVLTEDLSRWKGGGFGMFSTADTPFARFLRVKVVVDGEAHAVAMPAPAREDAARARVLPTQERLDALARDLGAGRWVRDEAELLDPESREAVRRRLALLSDEQLDDTVEEIDRICRQRVRALRSAPVYKMLAPEDPVPPSAVEVRPERVTVELWRYTFDGPGQRLVARRVRTAAAEPPPPLARRPTP